MARRNNNGEQKEILVQRIQQAAETITNLTSIISSAGTFTSVALVIIFAGFPIAGYFLVWKPQNEFQSFVTNNISNYLENSTQQRIDSALKNLESNDVIIAYRAMLVMQYYQQSKLNEGQIRSILNIIRKTKEPKDRKLFDNQLIGLLLFQESPLVKEFFKQDLAREGYRDAAFLYFSRNENVEELIATYNQQENKKEFFDELLLALGDQHWKFRERIYNDKRIVDPLLKSLNTQQIKALYAEANSKTYELTDVRKTYFYKRISP